MPIKHQTSSFRTILLPSYSPTLKLDIISPSFCYILLWHPLSDIVWTLRLDVILAAWPFYRCFPYSHYLGHSAYSDILDIKRVDAQIPGEREKIMTLRHWNVRSLRYRDMGTNRDDALRLLLHAALRVLHLIPLIFPYPITFRYITRRTLRDHYYT